MVFILQIGLEPQREINTDLSGANGAIPRLAEGYAKQNVAKNLTLILILLYKHVTSSNIVQHQKHHK